MPEGDTIHRTARILARVLEGRTLRRVSSPLPALGRAVHELVGRKVRRVDARGKNLLIRFDDETLLYTHMRMSGAWHVYRPGESWRKAERRARVVLETDDAVVVCFSAPVVERLTALQARHHPVLSALGPDLLSAAPDMDEIHRRLSQNLDRPVGVAIMDQRVLAGVGNVYKSEVLFLQRVDPFRAVGDLPRATWAAVITEARTLMQRNLDGRPRRTRVGLTGHRQWVYGRQGRPCYRCGTVIAMRRQGTSARSTYFCPSCQGIGATASGAAGT